MEDGEEFFFQVEGDIVLRIIENGKVREIPIREGEMFLLPPNIPHSPQRPANTVGLVIERRRAEDERDHLRWFCENCGEMLYDANFQLVDLGKQLKPIIEEFWADEKLRTCKKCGHVMAAPAPGRRSVGLQAQDLVEGQLEGGDQRVQRAHRGLHLARLHLGQQAG